MLSEDLNSDCQKPLNAGYSSMPLLLVLGKGKVKTGRSWRMLVTNLAKMASSKIRERFYLKNVGGKR